MTTTTVHNPNNEAHFMHVNTVPQQVRVHHGALLLADTRNALRVMETGRGPYDPVLYIPRSDVAGPLQPVEGKTTHCPLKGDASYFTVDGEEIAWTYDRPLEGAALIKDYVAFYANKVVTEEIGSEA